MNFSPESKVWLYLSSREFAVTEADELNELLNRFCVQWTAHGKNLHAKGAVLNRRFIVLMVDESRAGASGCSIDQSIHFIQSVERKYNTQLFNRMLVAIKDGEKVSVLSASQAKERLSEGLLNENTPVFNTLVQTKAELDQQFIIPLKESWLAKYLQPARS